MVQPGKIAVELSLMLDQFNKAILDANAKLTGMGKEFDQVAARMSRTAEGLGKAGSTLSKYLTLPILGIGVAALKTSADLEMMQAQFTTLLGNADRAKDMLAQIRELGAKTPFETQDIAEASKTLLGFSVAADEVIDVVKMLGDTAQGDGQKLQSIALAYGQINAQGKATMQDMRQLINAGVPIFQQLELSTGRTTAELMKMTERGEITGEVLKGAFQKMTSEGGLFFKGMETASQTGWGKWSTFIDTIKQAAVSFGDIFLPTAKSVIDTVTSLFEWINNLDEGTKRMVAGFALLVAAIGPMLAITAKLITAYKTFIVLKAAVTAGMAGQAIATGASTGAFVANRVAILALTAATKIWNIVLMANPIGLVIAAVVALGAAIYGLYRAFGDNRTAAEKAAIAQKELKDAIAGVRKISEETRQEIDQYTESLDEMNRPQKIAQLNDLLQEQRNRLRGLAFEDERRQKILDRISAITQQIHALEKQGAQETRQVRQQASDQWVRDYQKAQAAITKLIEEHGKNEQQLEEMRHVRAQTELWAQFKARQLTEDQYLKGSEILREQHEQKITEIVAKEEEKRRQLAQQSLQTVGGFVSDLGNLLQMSANNRIAEVENEQTRQMEQISAQYELEKGIIESTIANKKDRDEALKALDEKRARQEKAVTEKTEKEKRKIQREAAKQQQVIAIIDTTISTAQAAMNSFAWGSKIGGPVLGGILAAIATAFGLAKIALIKAQPLPAAAQGIYAETPYIGGEAGPELAFPLSSERGKAAMRLMADQLLIAIEEKLGQRETQRTPEARIVPTEQSASRELYRVAPLDRQSFFDELFQASQNGLLFIAAKGVVQ